MARAGRIIAVTLGLSAAGAVFGALAGAIALALSLALTERNILIPETLQVLAIPASLGAFFGAFGAPGIAWLLLRHVPLGRAFLWTSVGTVTGGIAGWLVGMALRVSVDGTPPFFGDEVNGAIFGAVAGLLTTSVLLRIRSPGVRA